MAQEDSVTQWVRRLQLGDDSAAERLWSRFFVQVAALARRRLQVGCIADEEDVALSAFKSLCLGLKNGRFPELADRQGLWRLLIVITARKIADQQAYDRRKKRDIARTQSVDDAEQAALQELTSREINPQLAVELSDQVAAHLQALVRPDLQEVALLKMEGYTNAEIAERTRRSLTTVERKLRTIRALWVRMP